MKKLKKILKWTAIGVGGFLVLLFIVSFVRLVEGGEEDVVKAPSQKPPFTRETLEQKTNEFEQSPQVVEHMLRKEEFIDVKAERIYWEIKDMAESIYRIPLSELLVAMSV